MDTQSYINALLFVINVLFGIVMAFVWRTHDRFGSEIKDLQHGQHTANVNVARDYVTRAEMQKQMDRVIDKLDEIQRDLREIKK